MNKFGVLVFEKIWPVSLKLGMILGGLGFIFGLVIGAIVQEGFLHCLKVGALFGTISLFCPILIAKGLSIIYALMFILSEALRPLSKWVFKEFLKK
jgi:hypothetical protein